METIDFNQIFQREAKELQRLAEERIAEYQRLHPENAIFQNRK